MASGVAGGPPDWSSDNSQSARRGVPEELVRLWDAEGLEVTRWGTVKADFRAEQTRGNAYPNRLSGIMPALPHRL